MNRVPTQTPSAPRASAAARPRPSKMPPAATTGTRSPTASTIWGTRAQRGDLARVAAGLGALGHDEVAAGLDGVDGVADLAAHVDDEDVVVVAEVDDVAGHAQPGHEDRGRRRSMICRTWASMSRADAVSRSTPKGLSVMALTASISRTISSACIVDAPRHPKPPASETAATSRE